MRGTMIVSAAAVILAAMTAAPASADETDDVGAATQSYCP